MARNLLVAYDLNRPGQNYEPVRKAICSLGPWYKLQYSLFFVQADMTAEQVYDFLRIFMDGNDKLLVAEASQMWFGSYPANDISAIQCAWETA